MTNTKSEINLIEVTADFLAFLSKKKLLIFSFIFVGLIVGYLKSKSSKIVYENSTIIVSPIESGEILCDVLQSLEIKDKSILAKQLNVSVESANQIKDITFEVIPILSKTLDRPLESRIKMNFIVYDEVIGKILVDGVKNYLKSNEYLQAHLNDYLIRNKTLLKIIKIKIDELETRRKFFDRKIDGKLDYIEIVYVDLFERKQTIESLIEDASIVNFVSSSEFKITAKPKALMIIITFTFVGFAFALIFGWLFDFYIKVKNV